MNDLNGLNSNPQNAEFVNEESLLTNPGSEILAKPHKPQITRQSVRPRWRFVLELHLAGHAVERSRPGKPSICELTGYTPASVYRILAREEVRELHQELVDGLDQEFKNLYPEVIEAVRDGLQPEAEPGVRLQAAKLWLKSHGKHQPAAGPTNQVNLTAEDVVIQILNQQQQQQVGG